LFSVNICPVVVVVNSFKAIYTCLAPLKGNHDGAVVSGFFIAPTTITAHPVGDPYGRGWGIASTVGRYETEAGVAKIVPLYRTTVGYVRLRPALKALPLNWGGLGFAHHPA
jgi:hypothetical protein